MCNIVFSCEHGNCLIPDFLNEQVQIPVEVLSSHCGFDIGALNIAMNLSVELDAELIYNEMTRLIMDYNRSENNSAVFGLYSGGLFAWQKKILLNNYRSYRETLNQIVLKSDFHYSIHSFTPNLNGIHRDCDIGILYDTQEVKEKHVAKELKAGLQRYGWRCRMNYPYLGKSDGITKYFRDKSIKGYCGIEIEINQNIIADLELVLHLKSVIKKIELEYGREKTSSI